MGAAVYGSNTLFSRGATTPELDAGMRAVRAETDDSRRQELWTQLGNLNFDGYVNVPLFWLPAEVIVDPDVVASFEWPGALSGFWSHLWQMKSA